MNVGILKNDKKLKNPIRSRFPEINYIKSLRNQFIQHPKFKIPFQEITTTYIPRDARLIPYAVVYPEAGGLVVLYNHHKKMMDSKQSSLPIKELQKMNKRYFIVKSHKWRTKTPKRGKAMHRLRSFGLPSFDQGVLSRELNNIFTQVVFPFLDKTIKKAKKDHVIF